MLMSYKKTFHLLTSSILLITSSLLGQLGESGDESVPTTALHGTRHNESCYAALGLLLSLRMTGYINRADEDDEWEDVLKLRGRRSSSRATTEFINGD